MKNKLEIPTYKPVKSNKIWENSHRIREKYSMKYDDNMKIRLESQVKNKKEIHIYKSQKNEQKI